MKQPCLIIFSKYDDENIVKLCKAFPGSVYLKEDEEIIVVKTENFNNCRYMDDAAHLIETSFDYYVVTYDSFINTKYRVRTISFSDDDTPEYGKILKNCSSFKAAKKSLDKLLSNRPNDDDTQFAIVRETFIDDEEFELDNTFLERKILAVRPIKFESKGDLLEP